MLLRCSRAGCVVAAIGFLWGCVPVLAQIPPPMPVPVNLEGTIVALGPGKLQVATPSGQRWMVFLSKRTSVMVTGKTEAQFLASGMYVRFQTEVTRRRKAAGPIERIQVFTPTAQDIPGAFPVQAFGPAEGAKPDKTGRKTDAIQDGSKYDIVGRIVAIQKGKISVTYGKGSIEIQPAEKLQVDLAVADIRFARPGDTIVCNGILLGSEAAKMTKARSIQITKAEPAPGPGEKPTDKSSRPSKDQKEKRSEKEQAAIDKLVGLLTLKKGKPSGDAFKIEGDPTEFRSSTRHPAALLEHRFGQAKKTPVQGILTHRGRPTRSAWQMWTWGPVKVIVDRSRKTRFFAVGEQEPARKPVSGQPAP